MKSLFVTASAIAAASLLGSGAAAAPKDKAAKPAAATAPASGGPEIAEESPANANAATPATPAAPATPASPATAEGATQTATPATPATPAQPATAAAQPNDPATILRNEFPAFDTDKSGELSNAEFATWMAALRKNSPGQALTPEQQTAWITQSFAQADTSKNGTIALDELTKFLVKG